MRSCVRRTEPLRPERGEGAAGPHPGRMVIAHSLPMKRALRSWVRSAVFAVAGLAVPASNASASPEQMASSYEREVVQRLQVPEAEAHLYTTLAADAFKRAGIAFESGYVAIVDRNSFVQAILVVWLDRDEAGSRLVGASPVSTGRLGEFDHFETPLGVFDHTPANPDFRAEGTRNQFGIRGYGVKGMRVFDLGWQTARQGWGLGGTGTMRLQMHATDPDILERRLGSVQSKGCIRISATLDQWLDRYGVLDAQYDALPTSDARRWVVHGRADPLDGAGRFLIVVDTVRGSRPEWATMPRDRPLARS